MIKIIHQGRLGNKLLQNIGISLLAKKFNYKVENYSCPEESKILGFNYYSGFIINENFKTYYDKDIMELLNKQSSLKNGIIFDGLFQIKDFIINNKKDIQKIIIPLKEEKINNNVFIHVRLGDISYKNPGFDYYDNCLKKINFKDGYVSSDDLNHPLVEKIIQKYNLKKVFLNPAETIKFGSRFENIILSHGTFSWWIGFLSKNSNVFFPKYSLKDAWHGDIFVFPEWNEIDFRG